MKKLVVLALFTLAAATPLLAQDQRSQSYFTFDDGGTIVRQGDNAEIEGRVNLPVYPGDEVITSRRGRSEIRLSDGNVIGLDRATTVVFRSILDSYEGESSQTIAELRGGHIAALRTSLGHDVLRIDTANASYVALDQSTYSVATDGGNDRIVVFDGTIEVRTPQRTTRVHAGDEARVDRQGMFGLVSNNMNADEFERWFIRRGEHYGTASSRYLDQSLAYADNELSDNGSWQYVSSLNSWGWRPYVSVGWRPYFYGSWSYGPAGYLTWVSYEPWGWVPYHYGRWAYDPFYGWVWLPGGGYSPAWVYWAYGPNYVGWAPAGWWDCYQPYYNWCYRPYSHDGHGGGYGFYGRVSTASMDLRPWTFVDPHQMVSTRIDRAALTTDVIKDRLSRGNGGYATVGSSAARFNRNELKDPNTAVNVIARRGFGGGTGKEGPGSSTAADVTPFIRRDPDLSPAVRDHIVRGVRPGDGTRGGTVSGGGLSPVSGGGLAPIAGGSVAPIGGGALAPIGSGSVAPSGSNDRIGRNPQGTTTPPDSGRIDRGRLGRGQTPNVERPSTSPSNSDWRSVHPPQPPATTAPTTTQPPATPRVDPYTPPARTPDRSHADDSWRGRAVGRQPTGGTTPTASSSAPAAPVTTAPVERDYRSTRGSDVPRRIIDRIGGARIVPNEGSAPTPAAPRPAYVPRESSAPKPASPPPPPPHKESPPPPSHHDDSGSKVHRDH